MGNKIIIILSIVALFIAMLWDINLLEYEFPIPHENYKKITFDNFTGLNKPGNTLYGQKEFAFISTELRTEKQENKYRVDVLFHPARSYVYKKNIRGKELLTHELYHFHITEYCGRLLRQTIASSKNKINLSELETKYLEIENQMQKQYDYETYHSYVLGEQNRWQAYIDSCLESLKDYESPIIEK